MKKFIFTLQSLLEYKETIEKIQKADLSKAIAALRILYDEDRRLDESFDRSKASLERALRAKFGVAEALAEHDAYFRYLGEEKAKLKIKITTAEDYKNKCQDDLITTMKEIKAYKKLREEQYLSYLKEVQVEEEKNMGDLVSFNTINEK